MSDKIPGPDLRPTFVAVDLPVTFRAGEDGLVVAECPTLPG